MAREYFSEALVLDQEDVGELDRRIYLYTEELGKVVAKVKSARKIISKLSGHLQPLNFVNVRLVEKGGFQITDALTIKKLPKNKDIFKLLQFLKEMTFEIQPDKKLWFIIKKNLWAATAPKISYKPFLEALGFDPKFAQCQVCRNKTVNYCSKTEQVFLCRGCGDKFGIDELVLI